MHVLTPRLAAHLLDDSYKAKAAHWKEIVSLEMCIAFIHAFPQNRIMFTLPKAACMHYISPHDTQVLLNV